MFGLLLISLVWLLVSLARAHGAVEIALGGCLDDVLHGQRAELGPAREVSPKKLCPVPGPHAYTYCTRGVSVQIEVMMNEPLQ